MAEAWVRHQVARAQPWTLPDKDLVGGLHGPGLLELLGDNRPLRPSPGAARLVRAPSAQSL